VDLVLVLGPMKSGKSLELVSLLSPLRFSTVRHRIYQSDRHVRDSGVTSRSGGVLETTKTTSLDVALHEPVDVVGVDEVHMFDVADIAAVGQLLDRGTKVVVAGIDLDHRGELFAPVRALLELGPHTVTYRRAVCDVCRAFNATHTQVLASGEPFTRQLAPSTALPDDGTFGYEARCRRCFVRPDAAGSAR
jgi:thymidine kinase